MPYELTSFLTTVAASSASIVAILGGFIASKLISINSDRDAVLSQISDLEQQIAFKQNEVNILQKQFDEDDALSFISEHIKELTRRSSLDNVYRKDIPQEMMLETLRPYWERAITLVGELSNSFDQNGEQLQLNPDTIPLDLAKKYKDDAFAYSVLTKILKFIKKETKSKNGKSSSPFGIPDISPIDIDDFQIADRIRLNSDIDHFSELKADIKWLKLQRSQLLYRKNALKKPKGMLGGLIIFALFAIACIIVPLALSPRYTESLQVFWTYKIIILILFIAGLVTVFGYLNYLLQWEEGSTENEQKEK